MGSNEAPQWKFKGNDELNKSSISVRGAITSLVSSLNKDDLRPVVPFARADPSGYPSFRTSPVVSEALVEAVETYDFNSYPSTDGLLPARRAIAEYLSRDLSYKLMPNDVFLTVGCTQAIEIVISVLARPGANILFPRPGFPQYEARAAYSCLEVRHFDLLPDKGWEVDLDAVEALADENTTAIVIINPSNPCGNVFTSHHLKKIAETARKLGIFVISDEVYGRLTFGSNSFVPMGEFGSIAPVMTLGSISKRWVVPGWRLGWIATTDPNRILQKSGIVETIRNYLNITTDPPTIIQAAVPKIVEQTNEDFFLGILDTMRNSSNILYERIKEIPCLTCPQKPEGAMTTMVKLNLELLNDISDDVDFCVQLAKEESVIVLPGKENLRKTQFLADFLNFSIQTYAGCTVGKKNWLRFSFAMESSSVEDGITRIKAFYERHARKHHA